MRFAIMRRVLYRVCLRDPRFDIAFDLLLDIRGLNEGYDIGHGFGVSANVALVSSWQAVSGTASGGRFSSGF
jgi:hypothetical protein